MPFIADKISAQILRCAPSADLEDVVRVFDVPTIILKVQQVRNQSLRQDFFHAILYSLPQWEWVIVLHLAWSIWCHAMKVGINIKSPRAHKIMKSPNSLQDLTLNCMDCVSYGRHGDLVSWASALKTGFTCAHIFAAFDREKMAFEARYMYVPFRFTAFF